MWQCPKCGKEFKKGNQEHICGEGPRTIDDYISAQSEEVQSYLIQVRNAIRAAIPGADERISWSMPTYWSKRNIIHFAAFNKHIGQYPGPKAIEHFANRLAQYKSSKGAVQFQYSSPLPLDLIADIARWCYETGNHH